jgi:arylsulfatase A-like enzyme
MRGLLPTEPKVTYTRNGERVSELPGDYYSSKDLTDFIIECIDENPTNDKPFFAYLAYQAPHGPLAVPDEWRGKYRGRYDKRYDANGLANTSNRNPFGLVGKRII